MHKSAERSRLGIPLRVRGRCFVARYAVAVVFVLVSEPGRQPGSARPVRRVVWPRFMNEGRLFKLFKCCTILSYSERYTDGERIVDAEH
jgi:hypothetical protein